MSLKQERFEKKLNERKEMKEKLLPSEYKSWRKEQIKKRKNGKLAF